MWLVVLQSNQKALWPTRIWIINGYFCLDDALCREKGCMWINRSRRIFLTWSLMSVCECHSQSQCTVWTCLRINPDWELLGCGSTCNLQYNKKLFKMSHKLFLTFVMLFPILQWSCLVQIFWMSLTEDERLKRCVCSNPQSLDEQIAWDLIEGFVID